MRFGYFAVRRARVLNFGFRSSAFGFFSRLLSAPLKTNSTVSGFSAKKDLLAQLLALNQAVAQRIENGEPVTAPGVPKNYPEPKSPVTDDCVKPPSLDRP